jgi:hypothetical protein
MIFVVQQLRYDILTNYRLRGCTAEEEIIWKTPGKRFLCSITKIT